MKVPWTIHADKLVYNEAKHTYEARGHVRLSATDRMIEADYASINNLTRVADLRGDVTVRVRQKLAKRRTYSLEPRH